MNVLAGEEFLSDERLSTVVLFALEVQLAEGLTFTKDVYAGATIQGGAHTVFRALLGDADIYLSEDTQVLRWIHAEKNIFAGKNCQLNGRVSAQSSVNLSSGCGFQRMHAPLVRTALNADSLPEPPHTAADAQPAAKKAQKLGRSRVNGDLHLGTEEMFLGNIIATGSIRVGAGSRIFGSAKGNGDVHLDSSTEVDGSLVSTRSVRIGADSFVKGPLLAEEEIHIGRGTTIGSPECPTTISAPRIYIAPDCTLHGTIWARVEGKIEG